MSFLHDAEELVTPGDAIATRLPDAGGHYDGVRTMTQARRISLLDVQDDNFTEHDWRRLLAHLGEDPKRQGLRETPQRVEKAWKHWTSGYQKNPAEILKVFEDGAEQVE